MTSCLEYTFRFKCFASHSKRCSNSRIATSNAIESKNRFVSVSMVQRDMVGSTKSTRQSPVSQGSTGISCKNLRGRRRLASDGTSFDTFDAMGGCHSEVVRTTFVCNSHANAANDALLFDDKLFVIAVEYSKYAEAESATHLLVADLLIKRAPFKNDMITRMITMMDERRM